MTEPFGHGDVIAKSVDLDRRATTGPVAWPTIFFS
jgi:hypothetical protein